MSDPAGGPTSRAGRAITLVRAGRCPCDDCKGTLTDPKLSPNGWGHCRRCRCAWKVVDRGALFADSIASTETCAAGARRVGLDAVKKEASDD